MKRLVSPFVALALLMILSASAHAQLIDFGAPTNISSTYSATDIVTNGTYVDALHTDNTTGAITVLNPTTSVSTVFNAYSVFGSSGLSRPANTYGDATFTITADGDYGGDGSGGTTTPYQSILNGSTFVNYPAATPAIVGTVIMSGLTPGAGYQVQVWASAGYRPTSYSSADTQELNFVPNSTGQFVIGTFIAPAAAAGQSTSSEYFTYYNTYPIDVSAGEINAISLRELPEPSTYAMMLVGIVGLGLCVRRKYAPQS